MPKDNKQKMTSTLLCISLSLITLTLSAQQVDDRVVDDHVVDDSHQSSKTITNAQQSALTSSFGTLKSQSIQLAPLNTLRDLVDQQAIEQALTDTKEIPLLYQTRTQRINNRAKFAKSNKALSANTFSHNSFVIYDAYTQLFEDFDGDGFYQTFSVTFDADVYTDHFENNALVYADLYLSENGGPWVHYFTTDSFFIYGESSDDKYEVYTTLNNGYIPDHYDVLIDLYEEGYNDIVATFSANDSNNLYALPLESSNYDPDHHQQSTSHGHGGSSSLLSLLVIMITLATRKTRQITKCNLGFGSKAHVQKSTAC
jgi:hypothetical protein